MFFNYRKADVTIINIIKLTDVNDVNFSEKAVSKSGNPYIIFVKLKI
jgi:hypothetical protein